MVFFRIFFAKRKEVTEEVSTRCPLRLPPGDDAKIGELGMTRVCSHRTYRDIGTLTDAAQTPPRYLR